MNYLIKFGAKRNLRLLLRDNHAVNIRYSSVYQIDNCYYILLITHDRLIFPDTINLQLIQQKSAVEEYLFNWARSEVLQSLDYIGFEQNSCLINNSRMIEFSGVSIYRSFEQLADIFAILNYTPDSFSDGGKFNQVDSALNQIEYLCKTGANIIDLGVTSARPMAKRINDAKDEIKLLKQILPPVLELKHGLKFELSIDTCYSDTVLWLADFAIDIINDVSGSLSVDLVKQILNANKRYVAMHSLSVPSDPNIILAQNINPIEYIAHWMANKIESIGSSGCDISNLILDPGIGFGINPAQSWFVAHHLDLLRKFPCEMLFGNSRKSFFTHITLKAPMQRDLESAIVAARVLPYVDYLRLHDLKVFNEVNRVFNQLSFL